MSIKDDNSIANGNGNNFKIRNKRNKTQVNTMNHTRIPTKHILNRESESSNNTISIDEQ